MTQRAISLPFSFASTGQVSYTEDERKIWQDRVVLVVMTYVSERIMRPKYGTKARAAVFENTDSAITVVKSEVSRGFSSFLQDLTLLDVKPTIDPVDGILQLEISYKYGKSVQPEIVTIQTNTFTRSGDIIKEG